MYIYRWWKALTAKPITMLIKIKNLKVQTLIGINDWEREEKQDVIINAEIEFDGSRICVTDDINDTANYRTITKRIISTVEASSFFSLEKLAYTILQTILEDKKVLKAKVEVDKPYALRFADSVSVQCESDQKH